MRSKPETTVMPIHFEDRSGSEFERLCFAYVLREKEWKTIDWYGQLGSDEGRDIWGVVGIAGGTDENHCFQCANHRSLRFAKVKTDLKKILSGPRKSPDRFVLICGGKVSAKMKEKIENHARAKGIRLIETWSGVEFEEKLRRDTPSLIKRFVDGEPFPESVDGLKVFAEDIIVANDENILSLMAHCFDRPAFTTPFSLESSIPAFKKAITDTVEVLNTGMYRLRDGMLIRKIPSRHDIKERTIRDTLSMVVEKLTELRNRYDGFLKAGDIRPCGCKNPDCPVFFVEHHASRVMDDLRREVLGLFRSVYPSFGVTVR